MAYTKFKPQIWTKFFEKEELGAMKSKEFVNTKFQGEAERGKTVVIQDIGMPTIVRHTGTDTNFMVPVPEELADNSLLLAVDQYDSFNVMVGNIDEAQANGSIKEQLAPQITNALSIKKDMYVMSKFADATDIADAVVTDEDSAMVMVDEMLGTLFNKKVPIDKGTYLVVDWNMYKYLKKWLVTTKTDNDELIKKGIVGYYSNAQVLLSNYIHKTTVSSKDYAHIGLLTKNAIALATGIHELVAFIPDRHVADAIKGVSTFGAKIYRQEQIVVRRVEV